MADPIVVRLTQAVGGWPVGAELGYPDTATATSILGAGTFEVVREQDGGSITPPTPEELSEAAQLALALARARRLITGALFDVEHDPATGTLKNVARPADVARQRLGLADPNPGATRLLPLPGVMATPPTVATSAADAATSIASGVDVAVTNGSNALVNTDVLRYRSGIARVGTLGGAWLDTVQAGNATTTTNFNGSFVVEFMYDGDQIEVLHRGASQKFRVMVDGQYVSLTPTTLPAFDGKLYRTLLTFASRTPRRIALEEVGGFRGLRIQSTATVWRPLTPVGPRVAILGDSYTHPGPTEGVPAPFMAYHRTLGQLLGWGDVVACGVGGSGFGVDGPAGAGNKFGSRVTADIIARSPDVVIAFGGQNDGGVADADFEAGVRAVVEPIRAALGAVPLILVGPQNPNGSPVSPHMRHRDTLASVAAEAGAVHIDLIGGPAPYSGNSANYVNTGWITGTGKVSAPAGSGNADLYIGGTSGSDGNHPTQAGHQYYGYRLASAIAALMPFSL